MYCYAVALYLMNDGRYVRDSGLFEAAKTQAECDTIRQRDLANDRARIESGNFKSVEISYRWGDGPETVLRWPPRPSGNSR